MRNSFDKELDEEGNAFKYLRYIFIIVSGLLETNLDNAKKQNNVNYVKPTAKWAIPFLQNI